MHNGGIYRALVVKSDSATGEVLVAIPALGGALSTFPITYIGRSEVNGIWEVPEVNEVVLVALDDSSASTVFLVPSYTHREWALPAGGNTGDLLVKNSATNYDAGWTDSPTVDSLTFDTTANEAVTTVGQTVWDDTYGSPKTLLKGGNVYVANGQALYQRVTNATGGTLTKGQAVYLSGASGQKVTVALALATTDPTSSKTFGVVAETIAHNQQGYVITEGLLQGFDTNTLTEGALVWLSPTTAGGLTTTKPSAPNHAVMVGVCVKSGSGSSGSLFVKVQNGYELDELHDVSINPSTLANNSIIQYNTSTGLWTNASAQGLSTTSSPAFSNLTLRNSAGTYRSLFFSTGASIRWALYADPTPESSGNAGSDLRLSRYNDDGTGIGNPSLIVSRSSGNVIVPNGLVVTSGGQDISGSWTTFSQATTRGTDTNITGLTMQGAYMTIGKTVFLRVSVSGGTATGTGNVGIALPTDIGTTISNLQVANSLLQDGVNRKSVSSRMEGSGMKLTFWADTDGNNFAGGATLVSTHSATFEIQ